VRNRLTGQLDQRPVTELQAQSGSHFISREQNMRVDYLRGTFGDLITLRYQRDLARADSPMVTLRVASK
jgi:hypothetical protein